MRQNPILDHKLDIYRKFLVQEFLREFKFIMDVLAGRATAKGDFTDKICAMMKWCATVGCYNIPFPGAHKLSSFTDIGVDWINGKRKESKNKSLEEQDFEFDQEQLRILLEMVALEASRRYEFVIDKYLSDDLREGVIALAKTQVERMLEYVARNKFPLTQENLLTGIIAGHSGAYVTGWNDTKLPTKHDREAKFTAEGLCGRPALMSTDTSRIYYWWLTDKKKAVHKKNQDTATQKEPTNYDITITRLEKEKYTSKTGKIKQLLKKIEKKLSFVKESLYDYGFTRLKEGKNEPKYGYILVSTEVIKQFGYEEQPKNTLDDQLCRELENYPFSIRVVNRAHIEEYLKSNKTQSFNDFIRAKYANKIDFQMTLFEAVTEKELNFKGFDFANADFSNCILNGICLIGSSLIKAKFKYSYLIGANLTLVNASKADFSGAHMEYVDAKQATFDGANFTQTHMHYADLQEAKMEFIQYLGSLWVNANLRDIKTEDASRISLLKEQQEQIVKFGEKLSEQSKAVEDIQTNLDTLKNDMSALKSRKRKHEEMKKQTEQTEEETQQHKVQKKLDPADKIQLSPITTHMSSIYATPKNSCLLKQEYYQNIVKSFSDVSKSFKELQAKFNYTFEVEQEANKLWISLVISEEMEKNIGKIVCENLQTAILKSLQDCLVNVITDNTITKVQCNSNSLFIKTNTPKQAEKLVELLQTANLFPIKLDSTLQNN